jgi:hypothetical protein
MQLAEKKIIQELIYHGQHKLHSGGENTDAEAQLFRLAVKEGNWINVNDITSNKQC